MVPHVGVDLVQTPDPNFPLLEMADCPYLVCLVAADPLDENYDPEGGQNLYFVDQNVPVILVYPPDCENYHVPQACVDSVGGPLGDHGATQGDLYSANREYVHLGMVFWNYLFLHFRDVGAGPPSVHGDPVAYYHYRHADIHARTGCAPVHFGATSLLLHRDPSTHGGLVAAS